MNSLVQVRMNMTGLGAASRESRVEAARQASAAYLTKTKAALEKAGVTVKSDDGTRQVNQELGRDAFLQLMVLQLQNQDPMAPMDNTAMIAQLAQFSALEQMNNLNESFSAMGGTMQQLNFIAANGFLGRNVSGIDIDGELRQGAVDRVLMDDGTVYLMVGGAVVPVANVMEVNDTQVTE